MVIALNPPAATPDAVQHVSSPPLPGTALSIPSCLRDLRLLQDAALATVARAAQADRLIVPLLPTRRPVVSVRAHVAGHVGPVVSARRPVVSARRGINFFAHNLRRIAPTMTPRSCRPTAAAAAMAPTSRMQETLSYSAPRLFPFPRAATKAFPIPRPFPRLPVPRDRFLHPHSTLRLRIAWRRRLRRLRLRRPQRQRYRALRYRR